MAAKKSLVTYKRDKYKVEISGESEDVKWPIWVEVLWPKILWLLIFILLLFTGPKASFIPVLWEWLKRQLPFLTLSPAVVVLLLLLSS